MNQLTSPQYNFADFCIAMLGKDYLDILDAASAEITYALQNHRERTRQDGFPKHSIGDHYCHNLQMLISMLMNGAVPKDAGAEYMHATKPLVQDMLRKWEIGNLRQVYATLPGSDSIDILSSVEPLVIVVSRSQVESADIASTLSTLSKLTASPATARNYIERVEIAFDGYNHMRQELFELQQVRHFVQQLDAQFPYWLYFLSKRHTGLQCILLCHLPPFLTEQARARIFPEMIHQLLVNRWFPAMNYISEYAGLSDVQNEVLTERALSYITDGKFPLTSAPFRM